MKICFILCVLPLSLFGQSNIVNDSLPRIITSDVYNFWNSYDQFWRDTTSNPFEDYLVKGSMGLAGFIPGRIKNAEALKKKVLKEHLYYEKVRPSILHLTKVKKEVQDVLLSLKRIYPQAILPDVYFVIGRINSGGTSTSIGIIVGLESFSNQTIATSSGRESLPLESLTALIAHELIHFLQTPIGENNTLLKQCIIEGSADFIAELMGYKTVIKLNGEAYKYGDLHEQELWKAFYKEKDGTNYSAWLYNFGSSKSIPNDLGYWIGHKITADYYAKASDKQQAIYEILHINDYDAFLRSSGH
ncbi:MAG TPA: DUF2268 domain-containing putative Zn-dependent protease [Cyclobacteriaceae bacterium]|jgi:hypothetical protein|nr:DUF2268 domain-containing putative Zn-dependent protease [Cyclobacteriaceae bacterium]